MENFKIQRFGMVDTCDIIAGLILEINAIKIDLETANYILLSKLTYLSGNFI